MTSKKNKNFELDDYFAAAQRNAPKYSNALKDKVLNDANQEYQKLITNVAPQNYKYLWIKFFTDIGGFYSVTGYGVVAAMSIFIGFLSPNWSYLVSDLRNNITMLELEFEDTCEDLSQLYLGE